MPFFLTLLTAVPVSNLSLSGCQLQLIIKLLYGLNLCGHFRNWTIILLSTLIYANRYLNYTSNVTRVHDDKFDAKNASRVTKSAYSLYGTFFLHNLVRGGEIFKLDRGPLFLLNEMAFRDFQSRLNFHCELTACMQRSILY